MIYQSYSSHQAQPICLELKKRGNLLLKFVCTNSSTNKNVQINSTVKICFAFEQMTIETNCFAALSYVNKILQNAWSVLHSNAAKPRRTLISFHHSNFLYDRIERFGIDLILIAKIYTI